MNIFEIAKHYLKLGFSVIPVKPNSKIPAMEWKEFQSRRMTAAEVDKFFQEGQNIGLVTGRISGVVVVDQDAYKDRGISLDLSSPLFVQTARGGGHFYFKYSPMKNTVNKDLATDVRGDGGYVVLPPSVFEKGKYRWNQKPTPDLLRSLQTVPKEFYDAIYQNQKPNDPWTSQRFDTVSAFGVGEGGRNDTLYRLAVSLLSKHPEDEAWRILSVANATAQPPLPDRELQTLWGSASQFVRTSPPIKPSLIVSDSGIKTDNSFEEDLKLAEKFIREGVKKGLSTGYGAVDEIIGGYYPGQSYLFYADTSVGKSLFVLNSLMRISKRGIRVMYFDLENSFDSMTWERMVLINEGNLTKKELDNMSKEERVALVWKLKGLPFFIWDQKKLGERFGSIVWKDAVEKCVIEGVREGYKIFAIDHLHYFEGAEQNHNLLASISKDINDLAARHHVIFLLVAHTKKGLLQEQDGIIKTKRPTMDYVSGSGLITRHTKNVIGMYRNGQADSQVDQRKTILFVDKTKNGPVGKVNLDFNPDTLVFSETAYEQELSHKVDDMLQYSTTPSSHPFGGKSQRDNQDDLF